MNKERLTVTLDPSLIHAGNEAIADGVAESMSAWVSLALADRVAKERRERAMLVAVAAYEAEFGEITAAEMDAQRRADQRASRVVRGRKKTQA